MTVSELINLLQLAPPDAVVKTVNPNYGGGDDNYYTSKFTVYDRLTLGVVYIEGE